ncbi:MAG TPA: GNVR domain-containing protein, partial [Bacteroidia bacterium]|nr:GNVR domain-containing protein [Bacteroidia bacterium]
MAKKKITPVNEEFDFKLFVTIAEKNFGWFVLFMISSLIIALIILRYTTPIFESASVVKLSTENNVTKELEINKNYLVDQTANQIAGDIELIKSRIILERAVKKLPLDVSYYAKGTLLDNEMYKSSPFMIEYLIKDSSIIGLPIFLEFTENNQVILSYTSRLTGTFLKTFNVNQWIILNECNIKILVSDFDLIKQQQSKFKKEAYFILFNTPERLARIMLGNLNVSIVNPDAKTISIRYKDASALKTADMVNSLATEFVKYDVEKSREGTDNIIEFIDTTLAKVNSDLRESEMSLESFKRDNRMVNPDLTVTETVNRIRTLEDLLVQYNLDLSLLEKLRNDINVNKKVEDFILRLTGTFKTDEIKNGLLELNSLLKEKNQISIMATEQTPQIRDINSRIENQKKLLIQTIINEEASIKEKRQNVYGQLNKYNSDFSRIPSQQAEYERLQRVFSVNEKFFSLLLEKKAEFSITRAGFVPKNIILEKGYIPGGPVYPNKTLIISASLMVGFIVSLLLIFIRYLFYAEIGSLEEIAQYTDAPLLGVIPQYKREIPISQLLVDKNPKSVIAEAFRSVRTNLQFISNEVGPKIMAVTSTISGEGKTFNAINLAGVISFSGKKVVILDLDMRKPKIHLGFNVENNRGVSTLLI